MARAQQNIYLICNYLCKMKMLETQVYKTVEDKYIRVIHLGKNSGGEDVVKVLFLKHPDILSPITNIIPYIFEKDAFRMTKEYEQWFIKKANENLKQYKEAEKSDIKVKVRAVKIDKHGNPIEEVPEKIKVDISDEDIETIVKDILGKLYGDKD